VKRDAHRQHLVLSEVLRLVPPEDYPVKMSHIGILYAIDQNRDGRFTLAELEEFAILCRDESSNFKAYEFNFQLQALCTVRMSRELRGESADSEFSAWIGKMLYENSGVEYFKECPSIPFVSIESVKLLYDIMDMKMFKSFSLQDLFNLLQQAAEEINLMPLECKNLDNHIPLSVCQDFARDFFLGFNNLFKEIGLHKTSQ